MRRIEGIAGCKKGIGAAEVEDDGTVCVRVIDTTDHHVAIRIGTHETSARLTPEEATHFADLITRAAARARGRGMGDEDAANNALVAAAPDMLAALRKL